MTAEHEPPQPKFELGQLVGTPGALEAFQRNGQEPFEFVFRHVTEADRSATTVLLPEEY